jgi:palmitoyl transferase
MLASAVATAQVKEKLSKALEGRSTDIIFPIWTWHNRYTYPREKTDRYNEQPYGMGIAGSKDYGGSGDMLYFMTFRDSHNMMQASWGYAWQKWIIGSGTDGFRLGAGWTISIQQRHEYHYVPIPLILPIAEIGYSKISVQATYIPGYHDFGNVLFLWGKLGF